MGDVDIDLSLLLFAPAAGLAADVVSQAVLSRFASSEANLRVQFISFCAGLLVMAALLFVLLSGSRFGPIDAAGYVMLHVLAYACLGFIFFNLINANISSLRVRMLKEYLARDPAPLSDAELYAKYPAADMVSARLARLEAGGQILARDDRYYLKGGGVAMIAALFAGLRCLLFRNKAA
jgi:hypothetical protein